MDVGTGYIHQDVGSFAMAEAAEKESCLFLSEWEAARRENHAIRRKYTEGQLLGYATPLEGGVFFWCHDSLGVLLGRLSGHKFQRRWFFLCKFPSSDCVWMRGKTSSIKFQLFQRMEHLINPYHPPEFMM